MPANKLAFPWKDRIDSLNCTADDYLTQNVSGMTDVQIAEVLSKHANRKVSFDTVNARRRRLGIAKTGGPNSVVKQIVSQSPFARYDSPPEIESECVVILPDIQFPYHHADFLNRVLDLCDKWKVKDCILAGDVLEFSSLTHFDPAWMDERHAEQDSLSDKAADELIDLIASMPNKAAKDKLRSFIEKKGRKSNKTASGAGEEWHHARIALRELITMFERKIWTMGNHEGRMLRQIQSPMLPDDIKRLFLGEDASVTIAPYYFCRVISGGVEWQVIHPKASAKGDAKWYASKYKSNIIMAHNHQLVMQKDRSGTYWAIETGCMVDEMRCPYVAQRQTKQDMHLLGTTIIRDGKAWLLHEDSPWDLLGKL